MLCGEFYDYIQALEKELGISGCPQECRQSKKRFDLYRTEMCDTCPRKRQLKIFKEETVERWEAWGITADFGDMLTVFNSVATFENVPDSHLSVKNSMLLYELRSEKSKAYDRAVKSGPASTK